MKSVTTSSIQPATGAMRFDLLRNPYVPSPRVRSLLEAGGFEDPGGGLLQQRLADRHQVEPGRIALSDSIDGIVDVLEAHYGPAQRIDFSTPDLGTTSDSPAYLLSPDPLFGKSFNVQEIVSLAQSRPLVLIDERNGGYSTRSHSSIASEFNTVVVLKSFENWASLDGDLSTAYAILPEQISLGLKRDIAQSPPAAIAAAAAITVLTDDRYYAAAVRRVVSNRMALFRMVRKLNTLVPERSGSNFIGCRVVRGERDELMAFLESRGIHAFRPECQEADTVIRFTALPATSVAFLKSTLLEWGRRLDDSSLS